MVTDFKLWKWLFHMELLLYLLQPEVDAAIMAPPWANPKLNPCASQPRGWQLLFWPPDGKCYKIFQVGYPCPPGMELSPSVGKSGKNLSAECRCTPEKAQSATDGACYDLFTLGPCQTGHYFGPDTKYKSENSKRQWGVCKQMKPCPEENTIFWPKDGKCYQRLTRGPCPKGQLLTVDSNKELAVCQCDKDDELSNYRSQNGQCYQHYTRGPCLEKGHLFLPNKTCGCHTGMPHYHNDTQQCFELGTIGPCAQGQTFQLPHSTAPHAYCTCKPGYIPYRDHPACYRPYTRGPCPASHILLNDSTTCLPQPCERGHLYFPELKRCHRIGTRGPCPSHAVVTFDFDTRPSVDGISYNGQCACTDKACSHEAGDRPACDRAKGLVRFGEECHKMYTQGPCFRGSWLVAEREGKQLELYTEHKGERVGVCECIPGYKRSVRTIGRREVTLCLAPTVMLAEYLNGNNTVPRVVSV
ncbi:unnamed protein product [Phaedon cochleariae]|uniref:DUF4789 domain-containing protein n=1 Tax=Phaedon cochleariae TaxID=80249 RepID=A0A9P0DXJ8_PHACE|nr:unnamed protein product [Phaedon cochleariae]